MPTSSTPAGHWRCTTPCRSPNAFLASPPDAGATRIRRARDGVVPARRLDQKMDDVVQGVGVGQQDLHVVYVRTGIDLDVDNPRRACRPHPDGQQPTYRFT
jgi:hypothetical protein